MPHLPVFQDPASGGRPVIGLVLFVILPLLPPRCRRHGQSNSGPVDVLSAGSLQDLLQQQVAPAFQKATGYTLNDTSMGRMRSPAASKAARCKVMSSSVPRLQSTRPSKGHKEGHSDVVVCHHRVLASGAGIRPAKPFRLGPDVEAVV